MSKLDLRLIPEIKQEYDSLKNKIVKKVNGENVRLNKNELIYFCKLDMSLQMIRGDRSKSNNFKPSDGYQLRKTFTEYGDDELVTYHGRLENREQGGLGRRIYWVNPSGNKLVVIGILTHDEQYRLLRTEKTRKPLFRVEDKDYPKYESNIESVLKNKKLFSVKGLGDLYSGDYNNDESILVYMRVDELSDDLLNNISDRDKRRYLFLDVSDLYKDKGKCYLYFEINYSEYQNLSGDSIEYLILNHEDDLWLSQNDGSSKPRKFKLDNKFYQYLEDKQNELIYIKSYKIKESIEILVKIMNLFESYKSRKNYRFTKLYKKN